MIDLHVHSSAGDGSFTPEEIAAKGRDFALAADGSGILFDALVEHFSLKLAVDWLRAKFSSFDSTRSGSLACDATPNEKRYLHTARRLGLVNSLPASKEDGANRPVVVVAVKMKHSLTERKSRLVQFVYAKKVLGDMLSQEGASSLQGLFFFYDKDGNFRLSLVTGDVDNGHFLGYTAKRRSFYCEHGEGNKIARRRLATSISTMSQLEDVFSVELLIKDFCFRLLVCYKWAVEASASNSLDGGQKEFGGCNEAIIRKIMRLMLSLMLRKSGLELNDFFKCDGTLLGDIGVVGELIDLLNRYEFAIDENEADDSDVVLDPEALGTVFENLLEASSSETGESIRKATGSFYTPREVVDYMVEESLRHYLTARVKGEGEAEAWKRKLDDLFDRDKAAEGAETIFTAEEKNKVVSAIRECRIFDPACGSGAFPMGALNCMVRLLERLASDGGSGNRQSPDLVYSYRLHLIENCLYGVDIQVVPIQITRLRLYLSLISDQLRLGQTPKMSLSDLKLNLVAANTLIGLSDVDPFSRWDPQDQEVSSPFFDPQLMFGVKSGFDVVIGNPPYFVIKQDTPRKAQYEKIFGHVRSGRMNIYQLFMAKCSTMLSDGGCMSFIHPRTLLADSYQTAVRSYLVNHFPSVMIVNVVGMSNAFDAVLQSVIITQWSLCPGPCRVAEIHSIGELKHLQYLELDYENLVLESGKFLVSGDPRIYRIVSKMGKVDRMEMGFVSGSIEWNQYKKYLSFRDARHDIRLLYAENVRRYGVAPSNKRMDCSWLSLKTLPVLTTTAVVCQRITSEDQSRRIVATMIDPAEEGVPIVTENHVNSFGIADYQECLYVLGVLNSSPMNYYFKSVSGNAQVSVRVLNLLPMPAGDAASRSRIAELVERILEEKREGRDTTDLESKIDHIVCELYGLTAMEAASVIEHS